MDRRLITGVTALIIIVMTAAGCGGPQNRQRLTYTAGEIFAADSWIGRSYDAWRQQVSLSGELPTFSDLGAYPIGNGNVFAITGLALPLGTVQDVLGPTYQKQTGLLGATAPIVLVDGEPILAERQSMEWIAPGGIVHSRWEGGPVQVDLLQTVPPELNAILTLMLVTNAGEEAAEVTLALQSSLPEEGPLDDDLLYTRGDIRIRAGFAGARTRIEGESLMPKLPEGLDSRLNQVGQIAGAKAETSALTCPLGAVQPNESVGKIAYLAISMTETEEADIVAEIDERGWQLFEDSHQWWQDWHERTVTVEGAGDEIDQFMAIQKYLCRVQQASAGGYSPMHKYSYRWIRDSNGPIKFLLDCGDFESVDRDLSYHFAGCAARREIYNNMPLNLNVDPDNVPEIDWDAIPTPKAESASFVILQNYWYWKHTGESEQLEERWPYLMAAYTGHHLDAEGRLPFHGDETYRFPGYQLHEARAGSVPDYVHLTLRSADSAFEYVAAAEAMAEMGAAIGIDAARIEAFRDDAAFVRRATEAFYWQEDRGYYAPAMSSLSGELYRYPFANICLRPTWIGYAEPDERQRRNVLSALSHLYRPEAGTANLTPACGYYVGMTPGYVLSALSAIDHPEAAKALEGVLVAASPSGGYAEMNRPDDTPSREVWGMHRVRPWEGGINGSAVLQYLTGFEPDAPTRTVRLAPHLPDTATTMTVRNLRMADANLTVEVSRAGDGLAVRVTCEEAEEPVEVRVGEGGTLEAGETLEVTLPLEVGASDAIESAGEFDYGAADVAPGATVLVTWSGEVARQVRETEGEVAILDTRISWPAEYLRSALLSGDRPRAAKVILDVQWPGAFKPGDFWTEGEGAEVISEYEAAGGVVEHANVPAAGGTPSEQLIN